MKKNFAVLASKSLSRKQSYVIVLDFALLTVSFHKIRRGKEVKRIFPFTACVKLDKHTKDSTQLQVTFGHEPQYKKSLQFQTGDERDLFCNLVHAVIVTGNKAYKLFKSLEAANGAGAGPAGSNENNLNAPNPTALSLSPSSPARDLDFCTFLISFSSSHTNATNNNHHNNQNNLHPNNFDDHGNELSVSTISQSSNNNNEKSTLLAPNHYRGGSIMMEEHSTNGYSNDFDQNNSNNNSLSSALPALNLRQLGIRLLEGEHEVVRQEHTSRLDTGMPSSSTSNPNQPLSMQASPNSNNALRQSSRGSLFLTNYRIIYRDYAATTQDDTDNHNGINSSTSNIISNNSHPSNPIPLLGDGFIKCESLNGSYDDHSTELPLGNILRVVRTGLSGCQLRIFCKDFRRVEFGFDAPIQWVETLMRHIVSFAFPKDQMKLFAFSYRPDTTGLVDGWSLYNPKIDYGRLDLWNHKDFRVTKLNEKYELCDTYPKVIIVPSLIDDNELKQVASYRSKERIPSVVWIHPISGASLTRCAQPLVGLKGKRSDVDEKFFTVLREINPVNSSVLHIIDARPYKAAMGNTVMGKGYENTAHYEKSQLHFMNIDNIHAIRLASERVVDLCLDKGVDDMTWFSKLEATQWLYYVRLLLQAAVKIATFLCEEGASVVAHCSDGWDRTSQLVSLTEIMLDPYYRTLTGFACLIEKEWLSFGHRFAERTGHGDPNFSHDQRAPIFLHWLDCVYQIWRQYPYAFEFNDLFLIDLLDAVGSARYGTFLYDCEQERHEKQLTSKTVSVWTALFAPANKPRYINAAYFPFIPQTPLTKPSTVPTNSYGYTIPNCTARRLVLWERLYMRWDKDVQRQDVQVDSNLKLLIKYNQIRGAINNSLEKNTGNIDLNKLDNELVQPAACLSVPNLVSLTGSQSSTNTAPIDRSRGGAFSTLNSPLTAVQTAPPNENDTNVSVGSSNTIKIHIGSPSLTPIVSSQPPSLNLQNQPPPVTKPVPPLQRSGSEEVIQETPLTPTYVKKSPTAKPAPSNSVVSSTASPLPNQISIRSDSNAFPSPPSSPSALELPTPPPVPTFRGLDAQALISLKARIDPSALSSQKARLHRVDGNFSYLYNNKRQLESSVTASRRFSPVHRNTQTSSILNDSSLNPPNNPNGVAEPSKSNISPFSSNDHTPETSSLRIDEDIIPDDIQLNTHQLIDINTHMTNHSNYYSSEDQPLVTSGDPSNSSVTSNALPSKTPTQPIIITQTESHSEDSHIFHEDDAITPSTTKSITKDPINLKNNPTALSPEDFEEVEEVVGAISLLQLPNKNNLSLNRN